MVFDVELVIGLVFLFEVEYLKFGFCFIGV